MARRFCSGHVVLVARFLASVVFFTVEASIVGVAVLFAFWALGETRGRSLENVRQHACFVPSLHRLKLHQRIDMLTVIVVGISCYRRWIIMVLSSEICANPNLQFALGNNEWRRVLH